MTPHGFRAPGDDRAPNRAPGEVGLQRSRRLGWLVASGSLGVCALLGVGVAHEIPGTTSHAATTGNGAHPSTGEGTTSGSSNAGGAETQGTGSSTALTSTSSAGAGISSGTSATTTGGSGVVSGGSAP